MRGPLVAATLVAIVVGGVVASEDADLTTARVAWLDATRRAPASALADHARALERVLARRLRAAGADRPVEERYACVVEADGLIQRELARRRALFAASPATRAEMDRVGAALAHHVTVSPIQRIVDYDDARFCIEVPPSPALDLTAAATFSAWVRLDGDVTVEDTKVINQASASGGKLALMLAPGNRVSVAARLEGGQRALLLWNRPLTPGRFNHVALTFDRDAGFELFLDGRREAAPRILSSPGARASLASTPAQPLYLGGPDRLLPGALDDVRIYGRRLTSGEISALAAGRAVGAGLVGHWPLDEREGPFARDAAGGARGAVGSNVSRGQPGAPELGRGFAYAFSLGIDSWRKRLRALEERLDALERERLEAVEPPPTRRPTVAGVLAALGAHEAVLVHYVRVHADGHLLAFRLDPHAARPIVEVDLGRAADADVAARTLALAADPARATSEGERRWRDAASALAALIWTPLEQYLPPAGEIWIRDDGSLDGVPFAALVDRAGRYLVERYAFAGTGPVAGLGRGAATMKRLALLAVGNPAFSSFPEPDGLESRPDLRGPGTSDCLSWRGALDGTRREIESVARLYAPTRGAVAIYEGRRASESRFKAASPATILHLATHGYAIHPGCLPAVPSNRLLRSGLQLAGVSRARPDRDRQQDDGYLSADELSRLDLSSTELVVFSGCSTAVEPGWSGERAPWALPSAAWIAGARASVASLWAVDDQSMPEDALALHAALRGGRSVAVALREAQLAALARAQIERGHSDPAAWGALVVRGR